MNYTEEAKQNFNDLSKNPYPGRGIVLGTSADGKSYVQVYWIMGRSVNSRNRVFEIEADTGFMKTKAFDESKLTDPHLIIYYPARHTKDVQIITNGDQTDTIYNAIKLGGTFESTTLSSSEARSKALSALASTKTMLRTSRRVFPVFITRMLNRPFTSSPSSRAVTTAKTLAANA